MSRVAEEVATSWPFSIDRQLGTSLKTQLRGQIEYGIACGEIPRGARLPSVRELSQQVGLAHATVAQVYKDLLARGLIVTETGRGTFVADVPSVHHTPDSLNEILNKTVLHALHSGYTMSEVVDTFHLLTRQLAPALRPVTVIVVGLFPEATAAYAQDLKVYLDKTDEVQSITISELRQCPAPALRADILITLPHRLSEVSALLPERDIIPVGFIPSAATRASLAGLDPLVRLAIVATDEEFLPMFLTGIRRFAPLVTDITTTHIHSPTLAETLIQADIIVYATGSDRVRDMVGNKPHFEYRHTLDPRDIERLVVPTVATLRHQTLLQAERNVSL